MGCGKKVYKNRKSAKKAKKMLNKNYKEQATNEYYCEECSSWHLTTMDKKRSRIITRRNNLN